MNIRPDAGAASANANRAANAIRSLSEDALGATPGFAVAVVNKGRIVFEQGYGVANVERMTPATAQTPFAIGSITKQFTAVAILMLAQDGKLSLDDHVAKYFPALPNAKTITIRELLWQTSGLHNYPNTNEHPWPLAGSIDPSAIFAILATDKPDFPPGTRWAYANTNYAVLAGIVAKVSGKSYAEFLRDRIFTPLDMTYSGYGYAAQQSLPVATPYTGTPFALYPQTLTLDLYYGAGGIVASAHDMALWMLALLQGRLLGPQQMSELWTPGRLSDGNPTEYAMGFVPAQLDGHREVWHNGFAPYAGGYCYDAIFPDDDIAVVVLTNQDQTTIGTLPDRIVRKVFEALK